MSETVNLPVATQLPGGLRSATGGANVTSIITLANIVQYSVPANTPVQGTIYRFTAIGNSDNTATAGTLTWQISDSSGVFSSLTLATPTTAQTLKDWKVEFLVTYRTVGATGSYVVSATGYSQAVAFGASSFLSLDQTTTTTINTTVNHNWTLSIKFPPATAGNNMRGLHGAMELVKI